MVKYMNFSAEYVESMPPVERMIYWQYYEKEEEEKRKANSKDNPSMSIGAAAANMGM
jgi:hypothetical protein